MSRVEPLDLAALERTCARARERLLAERVGGGHWEGELSSSALSTATAALALALHARHAQADSSARLAQRGRAWLEAHQNSDGGWGDSVTSPSNLSTTALAWTALGLAAESHAACLRRAEQCLTQLAGGLEPAQLTRALLQAYGADRTFSVPILTACALGGRLGEGAAAWRAIPALPFELAALPHRLFQHLGLPMVSYALPALIAIGQVLHHRHPSSNPLARLARRLTRARTLRTLRAIQPASGGYLEATPLTSFVIASLIGCGESAHPVVGAGVRFLEDSVRADGSWPIDTNLATWLTSLSIDALAAGGQGAPASLAGLRDWLSAQQFRVEHPYTHAAPGGWAWTDRTGGVPDADDTAGALIALAHLGPTPQAAVWPGLRWLLGLQNRDGGMPTFCRGWSGLPFDRSSPDLTAHALRAFAAWEHALEPRQRARLARARARALRYLAATQRADGAWVPLWFGNQHEPRLENPLYGTARVLKALGPLRFDAPALHERGALWLLAAQNADGGFGGARGLPSTLEETALGLESLAVLAAGERAPGAPEVAFPDLAPQLARAVAWLVGASDEGRRFEPAPIGLYFAKLWYAEKLYPLLFTVAALERARTVLAPRPAAQRQGALSG